ncbi:MmcQ/YjbR family DNA-binding protein [Daejeonia sp. YH14]|uniref:MmcQ/YjbR family DNA-binding protein n=1 Tax=Daejeonia sp. YH14 TaxID=3439042 RepID=UPI003F495C9E
MQAEEIREYCLMKKGVTESLPFDQDTLVFKVGGKIFVLLALEKNPLVFSAKATPEWSEELRADYPQIAAAWHMNKTHWNSVQCFGLPRKLLLQLIDVSYDLVFASLTRRMREEILKE